MYSAEDLFTEDDLIQVHDNENQNSGNEQQENENGSGDEQEQNAEANEDGEEKQVVKPKRVVRNPQPKLNVQTLQGPKGLPCLEEHFKNKRYKGRGHEQEDLRTVMKTYEYWCHRLFPKLPFDDCLAKIESLGNKKPMQTYLKRIRMGLVFDEEKPIQSDNDNEENQGNDHQAFDELVARDVSVTTQTPQVDDQQLTEEQMERIRLNKERADRLRREKLERQKRALAEASQAAVSGMEVLGEASQTADSGMEALAEASQSADSGMEALGEASRTADSGIEVLAEASQSGDSGMEALGEAPQIANSGTEVQETEDQLERIRVNKKKAEYLRQERLKRKKLHTSNIVCEERNHESLGLECESSNIEDATRVLDSVEDIRNGEEAENRLTELENDDSIQKKSKITDEIIQSDKERHEEAINMDCSS